MVDIQFPQVFVLPESERAVVHNGPAIAGAEGARHDVLRCPAGPGQRPN